MSSYTVYLPTTPQVGDEITISDAAGTFATNNCIVDPGTKKIRNIAETLTLDVNWMEIKLIYINETVGWKY